MPSPEKLAAALNYQGKRPPTEPRSQDAITQHHLYNLANNKAVVDKYGEGEVATVRTIQVEFDGTPTLIPTVWDGKIVSNNEAVRLAKLSGMPWPTASTHENLREIDKEIHKRFNLDVENSSYGKR